MQDYIQTYQKDPTTVSLKVHTMKKGLYHIVGEVSSEKWDLLCDDMGVSRGGQCSVDLVIEKDRGFLTFKGQVLLQTQRTCVRTLKQFLLDECLKIEDRLCLDATKAGDMDDVFEEDIFSVADFIREQIVLLMNPYPVHPDTNTAEAGDFDVSDNLQEKDLNEKNPFSVLKHLKS